MSLYRSRSNVGSALSRRANKLLAARDLQEAVAVHCSGYGDGCGAVESHEIEALMSARQVLIDGGIYCSKIHSYQNIPHAFYIAKSAEHAGDKIPEVA